MALHGWENTAKELSGLAARGRWEEMPALIDDEMLSTFAVVGDAGELAENLRQHYQGLADRLAVYIPFVPHERDVFWRALLEG
jgi:alkanesulfonate monooxygenase SsuD/methylene tetrahydromethanopterin reductase-like flavin-dependent oxidoreductase (luciferase family)